MYFEDLSPYRYGTYYGRDRIIPINEVLNVGWLEDGHDYPKGEVDKDTLQKLKHLLILYPNANIHHKGFHLCDFCDYADDNLPTITLDQKTIRLGSRVLWLPSPESTNLTYACPNLIYHYIVDHNYQPPDKFLEAVELAKIDPDWDVYKFQRALIEKERDRIRREEQ